MTTVLSGHNPEPHIVAVDHVDDAVMRLTLRNQGETTTRDEPFFPFFYLADPSLLEGFSQKHWIKKAEGSHRFAFLCIFESWNALWEALRYMIDAFNHRVPTGIESYTKLDALHFIPDPVTQYLLQSGRTLFKEMAFEDLHRLQLDIETYTTGTHGFSSAARPGDRIILIALSDNRGWEHLIDGRTHDEPAMLKELVRLVRQRNPDVIEGHNILGFDLPYILKRCAMHGIPPLLGRDDRPVRASESRSFQGEYGPDYSAGDISGRHVVDTYQLVQSYDANKRNMESHGLKYAARYFGLSSPDRVVVEGEQISWTWDNDPDLLVRYALDDVRETRGLSTLLSPSSFHLAQMVPCSYSTVTRIGAAAKIELLLVREYLRQKHSLPQATAGAQTTGGYTDMFFAGVLGPIVHADVESLYPSIMITRNISPASDTLGIFGEMLRILTAHRLDLKQKMRESTDEAMRMHLDAQQSSLKILINSFYGYLGYSRGLFNDYLQADAVTKAGQEILRQTITALRGLSAKVVEVDTDGVYFVPPPHVNTEEEERATVASVAGTLPKGISLVLDGRYRRMLSYRMKNYALLGYDNRLIIRGSSLVSRTMERFGRSYIRNCIERILSNDIEGLHRLYLEVASTIQSHGMDVRDFARVETLRDPIEQYKREVEQEQRNRSAAYEVAIRLGRRFRVGERVAYYITGSDPNVRITDACKPAEEWDPHFPDENSPYYLRRLNEFSEKFAEFFRPADFGRIFAPEDLFPFSAEGMIIQTRSVEEPEERPEDPLPNPGIWLEE